MTALKNKIFYILGLFTCIACTDDSWQQEVNNAPNMEGNAIQFVTGLHTRTASTRATFVSQDALNTEMGKFSPMHHKYQLTITMYKNGGAEEGTGEYHPEKTTDDTDLSLIDGTLAVNVGTNPLYWPDNVTPYAFKAEAGTDNVEADQSDGDKMLANDKLLGYGFEPLYNEESTPKTDDIDALNYRTSREWYAANKALYPGGTSTDWLKVPLYMKHQRAWITVKLKAGNGISRAALKEENIDNIEGRLFSYLGADITEVNEPKVSFPNITYTKDKNGEAGDEQTTQFDAIVEPFNFLDHPETPICKVTVNHQNFTYYSSNDVLYTTYKELKDKEDKTDDDQAALYANPYNLTAGKHLTITATLSTDRVILITALLEDWDEESFNSICDDYGQNGDPIIIDSRARLIKFLSDEKENKAGNTALISAPRLDLDSVAPGGETFLWANVANKELHCTLNLAGGQLNTSSQLLTVINDNATVVNGTINMTGETSVDAALCSENYGTIEQVNVTVADDVRQTKKATKGGLTAVNYGIIYNCSNNLMVEGTSGYVGGIAGESKYRQVLDGQTAIEPIIDKCIVNSRVGNTATETSTGAGGITGYAEGRVSNCTNTYGLTYNQEALDNHKNIVAATGTANIVNAYNNAWPTYATNEIGSDSHKNENIYTGSKYSAVIDCQEELEKLLTTGANNPAAKYRIADDFSVDSSWSYGKTESDTDYSTTYDLKFELDGQNKTITTNGTMLFSHINGKVSDLVINCNKPVYTESNSDSSDAIAVLAYSVNGENAELNNVRVKMADGAYVQAAMVSGIVLWAYDKAKITNCEFVGTVNVKFNDNFGTDNRRYAGGIVACSIDVTLEGCKVHTGTTIQQVDIPVVDEKPNPHVNLFRGGIIGGISTKEGYTPATVINESYSWWGVDPSENSVHNAGSIIGRTEYVSNNVTKSGIAEGTCEGNWWRSEAGYQPAGNLGNNYEKIIGRKNSVTPNEVIDY